MASLALGFVGTALGASIGGSLSLLGTTFSAAAIGGAIGSAVGSVVDSMIISALQPGQRVEGQRLDSLQVTTSTEGGVIPRPMGRIKVGGNIIWATDFREERSEETQGGKGIGGGPEVTTVSYRYYASFALAIGEGVIPNIGRVWADGEPMNLSKVTWRYYPGTETQTADPYIESRMGVGNTPAYRGVAYLVFEDLLLENYGNRIPQINVEVLRPLTSEGTLEGDLKAVTVIPGSGEFIYSTQAIKLDGRKGVTENVHAAAERPDFLEAIDRLVAAAPNLESVSLVVSWFGSDLRCAQCEIKPGVEVLDKNTKNVSWSVNGISRGSAYVVSTDAESRPVYGGTPSDFSVVEAIQELKARGLRVTLYPFVLMDIAEGNTLPDPYSDNAGTSGQPSFPWRGRITCSPAAGYVGTADKTATAKTQVDAFFGSAQISDFSVDGEDVSWTGGADWGLRRMILHYAHLATAAGGVDAFLIGSELRGLTQVRDEVAGHYPAVDQFQSLIEDVRTIFEAGGFEKYTNIVTDPSDSDMNAKGSINKRRQMDHSGEGWQIHPGSTSLQTNIDNFARTDALFGDYLTNHNDTLWHAAFLDIDVTAIAGQEVEFTFNGVGYSNSTMVDRSLDLEVYTYTQAQLDDNDGSLLNPSNPGTQHVNVTRWYATHSDGTRYFPESFTFTIPAGTAVLRIAFDLPPSTNIVGLQARAAVQYMRINQLNAPGTFPQLSYAADWSEYFGHQPADGTGDVYFNLDPLWAADDCDFVGVDNYMPLSDWRDGFNHLDVAAGALAVYEQAYLQGNIEGGEGYDWYYASQADRDAQVRTPITDGAYSKDWVFRYKDVRSWWSEQHYDRPGGVESGSPTVWEPESKPIRFSEFGCPAIDRGTNQPNVFYDPKSSESQLPYFSRGWRDEAIQRAYYEAVLSYWLDDANNPASGIYAGRMIDMDEASAWAWDARPYPFFPLLYDVWADGDNWRLGHWLTGRLGSLSLPALVRYHCERAGMDPERLDVSGIWGALEGLNTTTIDSARAGIDMLARHFGFDATESGGKIVFRMRGGAPGASFTLDDLVAGGDVGEPIMFERGQETEIPQVLKWSAGREDEEYAPSQAEARRITVSSTRVSVETFPFAVPAEELERRCRRAMQEAWVGRETARFGLPPSQMALDPCDVVTIGHDGRSYDFRVVRVADAEARSIEGILRDRLAYDLPPGPPRENSLIPTPTIFGDVVGSFMNLPQLIPAAPDHMPYVAVDIEPWPGSVRVQTDTGIHTDVDSPAQVGVTTTAFEAGPVGVWDDATVVDVQVTSGTLDTRTDAEILAGSNAFAIESAPGEWEVLQAANAELVGTSTYRLSRMLRGRRGTEGEIAANVAAGARFVVLDTIAPVPLTLSDVGISYDWVFITAGLLPDPEAPPETFTGTGRGLQPFSPVHVYQPYRTGRTPGDLTISWVRRSRAIEADSWVLAVVPHEPVGGGIDDIFGPSDGSSTESYVIEIMNGATVLRTLQATEPSVVYTSAQQIADWGAELAPGNTLGVRIYQTSGTYGRGAPLIETLQF